MEQIFKTELETLCCNYTKLYPLVISYEPKTRILSVNNVLAITLSKANKEIRIMDVINGVDIDNMDLAMFTLKTHLDSKAEITKLYALLSQYIREKVPAITVMSNYTYSSSATNLTLMYKGLKIYKSKLKEITPNTIETAIRRHKNFAYISNLVNTKEAALDIYSNVNSINCLYSIPILLDTYRLSEISWRNIEFLSQGFFSNHKFYSMYATMNEKDFNNIEEVVAYNLINPIARLQAEVSYISTKTQKGFNILFRGKCIATVHKNDTMDSLQALSELIVNEVFGVYAKYIQDATYTTLLNLNKIIN